MKVNCACVQMQFCYDKAKNLDRATELIREAAAGGAKLICLPELATTTYFVYEIDDKHMALAEPIPGPATDRMSALAKEVDAYIIFPLYEHVQDGELYNSAVLINPAGQIVGKYRKNSIAFVYMDESIAMEKYYFKPGNLGYPVFETDLGLNVGMIICYDRHFPEKPRSLALGGANIMFVPATTPAGGDMWEVELRAHAIANAMWVAAANRVGLDIDGGPYEFYGRSLIIAPSGEVVARASDDKEEVIYAEIDTALNHEFREKWGFFRDRRPETYVAVSQP